MSELQHGTHWANIRMSVGLPYFLGFYGKICLFVFSCSWQMLAFHCCISYFILFFGFWATSSIFNDSKGDQFLLLS
jgi:hypothetical protein